MSGWVDVYQRDDDWIYVSSHSRFVRGPLIVNGWCDVIASEANDSQLGAVVQEGLRVGGDRLRDVSLENVTELLRPLLKLAKVRSFAAFAKGTLAVGVERDDSGTYVIASTENRGVRTGFMFADRKIILPAESNVDEIGKAVRRGLASSCIADAARSR